MQTLVFSVFLVFVSPGKSLWVVKRVVNGCVRITFRFLGTCGRAIAFPMRRPFVLLLVSSISVFASLPQEAIDLKAKKDAKVAEINTAYLGALSKLADRLAAAGDASGAAEVRNLIANPDGDVASAEDAKLKPLIGIWKRDTDNGLWKIEDTKGGVFNGSLKFTMTYDAENNRVAVVGSHWADHLTFTSNPDVVHGSTMENGKIVRYKLKRVK